MTTRYAILTIAAVVDCILIACIIQYAGFMQPVREWFNYQPWYIALPLVAIPSLPIVWSANKWMNAYIRERA